MGKELEALERLAMPDELHIKECKKLGIGVTEDFDTVEKALLELTSIKKANPSEALELVDKMANYILLDEEYGFIDGKEKQAIIKDRDIIKQALLKAEKEHNSVNLLMQELDCKDFAELRKYARCGYEKINKHYLKWEDLEFKEEEQEMFVLLNGSCYLLEYYTDSETEYVMIKATNTTMFALEGDWIDDIQFFNDLHLERVEE